MKFTSNNSCFPEFSGTHSMKGFTLRPLSTRMLAPTSSRNVSMRDIGATHTLYPALQTCGVTERVTHGFTLIELLVVVLIIGILAAVALPQYKKVVKKTRLTEVHTRFKALAKGVDMWLLENGYPNSTVRFWRDSNTSGAPQLELDVDLPCDQVALDGCYTQLGAWQVQCSSSLCEIHFQPYYYPNGNTGNWWLELYQIYWYKVGNDPWKLLYVNEHSGAGHDYFCEWWRNLYGDDAFGTSPYNGHDCN